MALKSIESLESLGLVQPEVLLGNEVIVNIHLKDKNPEEADQWWEEVEEREEHEVDIHGCWWVLAREPCDSAAWLIDTGEYDVGSPKEDQWGQGNEFLGFHG